MYKGHYSAFMSAKRLERDRREKKFLIAKKEISHHQQFVDRFKAKASKARQAGSKQRMIEKMAEDIVESRKLREDTPFFVLKSAVTVEETRFWEKMTGIKKAYDNNEVLHGVDLLVQRGDRLAIMGPNGIGKSTLLKIAVEIFLADEGDVEWGYETHPGYFA